MDDVQKNGRVGNDDSSNEQNDDSRENQGSVVYTARLLANPRRIRL